MSADRQSIIDKEDGDGMLMVFISGSSRVHAVWFALVVTQQTNVLSADSTKMNYGLHATSKYNETTIESASFSCGRFR